MKNFLLNGACILYVSHSQKYWMKLYEMHLLTACILRLSPLASNFWSNPPCIWFSVFMPIYERINILAKLLWEKYFIGGG